MQRVATSIPALLAIFLTALTVKPAIPRITNKDGSFAAATAANSLFQLHDVHRPPSDLEVGGELAGLPGGTTRYIRRDELLALPQVRFTVTDDPNFTGATEISGVPLEELAKHFAAGPDADLVVAICDDLYRASYPHAYVAAHHPVLVLTVNGQPPSGWPKDSETHSSYMGPYMISHPKFVPSFKILSHSDEPQIPWGVVRLEFRDERAALAAVAPRGPHAADAAVQAGYRIALQNCFRCHSMGNDGGRKSGVSWSELARFATASRENFVSYVHDPQGHNPKAQMPANPDYDAATLDALATYFKTFAPTKNP